MLIKKMFLSTILMAISLISHAGVINFDDINTNELVNGFYLSEGVQFQTDDWLVSTGFGETTAPNFATSLSGGGAVNFIQGFSGQLTFSYGAFVDSVVSIYDGQNGTGNVLATLSMSINDITNFDFVSLSFSGIGYSAVFQSQPGTLAIDDLAFTAPQQVPTPPIIAVFLLGGAVLFLNRGIKR